jgi:hypothetical protein
MHYQKAPNKYSALGGKHPMKLGAFGKFTVVSLARNSIPMRLMKMCIRRRRLMKLSAFGEDGEGHKLDTLSANFLPK